MTAHDHRRRRVRRPAVPLDPQLPPATAGAAPSAELFPGVQRCAGKRIRAWFLSDGGCGHVAAADDERAAVAAGRRIGCRPLARQAPSPPTWRRAAGGDTPAQLGTRSHTPLKLLGDLILVSDPTDPPQVLRGRGQGSCSYMNRLGDIVPDWSKKDHHELKVPDWSRG
jgi:hypothetical protein